jgi:hypothetical protein
VKSTARAVYNHEPEPAGNGMLYGGAEVEEGIDAEAERSMACTLSSSSSSVSWADDGGCGMRTRRE